MANIKSILGDTIHHRFACHFSDVSREQLVWSVRAVSSKMKEKFLHLFHSLLRNMIFRDPVFFFFLKVEVCYGSTIALLRGGPEKIEEKGNHSSGQTIEQYI